MDQVERQRLAQQAQDVQRFRQQRQTLETGAAGAPAETRPKEVAPARVRLPGSPIVAKSGADLGRDQAPPKTYEAPKPDPKVAAKPRANQPAPAIAPRVDQPRPRPQPKAERAAPQPQPQPKVERPAPQPRSNAPAVRHRRDRTRTNARAKTSTERRASEITVALDRDGLDLRVKEYVYANNLNLA